MSLDNTAQDESLELVDSIEDIDLITKKIVATIPAERVKRDYQREINKLSTSVAIKGFRPGKAPRDLIEKSYGEKVRFDLARSLVAETLVGVAKQHKLEVVGYPEIDHADLDPAQDFKISASISIYPRPKIEGYKGLKVSVAKRPITDSDVDAMIEKIRASRASLRPIVGRDAADKDDLVAVELQIINPGEESKEAQPEPVSVVLGEKRFPEPFEAALYGMKVGEGKSVEVPVAPNASAPAEGDAEAKVNYSFTVTGIQQRILPEVDDGFAAGLNMGVASVLELRMRAREELEKEAEKNNKNALHSSLFDELAKGNEFAIPQAMIDDEIREMLIRYGAIDPKQNDPSSVSVEPFRDGLGEIAKKRLKIGVIVTQIGTQEGIEVSQDEIKEEIARIAQANNAPEEEVRAYLTKNNLISSVTGDIRNNKILDFLASQAEVTYTEPKEGEVTESPLNL